MQGATCLSFLCKSLFLPCFYCHAFCALFQRPAQKCLESGVSVPASRLPETLVNCEFLLLRVGVSLLSWQSHRTSEFQRTLMKHPYSDPHEIVNLGLRQVGLLPALGPSPLRSSTQAGNSGMHSSELPLETGQRDC